VALARLRAGLTDYARLTADHLFCMWTMWATDSGEKAALAAYLTANGPVPFAEQVLPPFEKSRTPPFPRVVRALLLGIAAALAVSGLSLVLALCLQRPLALPLRVSGICGIIVHIGLIVSALGSVGIPRYTIGLWPPMVVAVLFLGRWAQQQAMEMAGATRRRENTSEVANGASGA
jgi:hypothetical protein